MDITRIFSYYIEEDSRIKSVDPKVAKHQSYLTLRNCVLSKDEAEAHLALMQLHLIMDIYNDGWKSDWRDSNAKYAIYRSNEDSRISVYAVWRSPRFLTFKSQLLAQEFLKNFQYLLEIAKPLL